MSTTRRTPIRVLAAPVLVAVLAIADVPASSQPGGEAYPVRPIRFAGFDVFTWSGVLAPAGTPPVIVGKLQSGIVTALKSTVVDERIKASGFEPLGTTSEAFGAFLKSEVARWTKVVKQTGARID